MALTVEHLTRTYVGPMGSPFTAVDDFTLTGAGKTTTLRTLAGILRPTSGRVAIDGHDIVADSIAAKRRLAFMPDEPHLFEYLTVEEHLRLVARLYSVEDFERRARALIEELELKGKER